MKRTMDKKEIQELLYRYRYGECSQDEVDRIKLWYDSLNEDVSAELDEQDKQLLENRLLLRIRENITETESIHAAIERRIWWKSPLWYAGIAAMLIISVTYFLFFDKGTRYSLLENEQVFINTPADKLIIKENKTDQAISLVLDDKSVVTLSPGSRIVYPAKFNSSVRDVQLTGDAFFEIARNPQVPFYVYSGRLITRVLGTSFRIKTNTQNKALEVEVVTGKVSVFENKRAFNKMDSAAIDHGVVLTPNQRAIYFSESRHLTTGLVATPVKLQVKQAQPVQVFNNISLLEIAAALQAEYGIEIVFANEGMEKCTFTGDLSDMPLYEKMDLICKSNLAEYEVKGTRILINGHGCD
ncbi:hypothetical protein DYBT9275_04990 [Dyadobacter sp. CECT 9275]|uniref:FecR family protein n=1 Tax=Dyadobacter helix TaxID=2822344 RepID=A0A916JHK6_9BACT|nr:FecR family protein [Dyadobacter sp. CECT 9275]CAG5011639.1 hypothetical protein DYBT9275_04990 [Dyadobacter sp. CECT 9275]